MAKELQLVDQRLTRIEETQTEQQKCLAIVQGKLEVLADTLSDVSDTLSRVDAQTDKSGLLQKLLMGSIIIQSLLYGVTTPDAAKAAIAQIFGAH